MAFSGMRRLFLGLSAVALGVGVLGGLDGAARADPMPMPSGPVILTVTGAIDQANSPEGAQFDLAMLEGMDPVDVQTSTIWTHGPQTFTGVPLARLVAVLGAEGEVIAATALNEYTVEIPLSDAVEGGPILAFAQNGRHLSVRDKGPLWVIYPYDHDRDFQTEVIYARSIWQVKRMEIR
jgi:hypothetical protein